MTSSLPSFGQKICWQTSLHQRMTSLDSTSAPLKKKRMMKVLCKSFQIDFFDDQSRTYLQKTADARMPYLTIKDMLTPRKIDKHFGDFKTKFLDNSKQFPCKYVPYKTEAVEKEDFPRVSQKPTNKEVSQHDMSLYSRHSRGSSMDSEKGHNLCPHGLTSNSKLMKRRSNPI
jgi:hypothetical protein